MYIPWCAYTSLFLYFLVRIDGFRIFEEFIFRCFLTAAPFINQIIHLLRHTKGPVLLELSRPLAADIFVLIDIFNYF